MCGCILGWRSVAYHNLVTVTLNLTSDLVSRNCCISPIFFEIGIPNLVCKCILGYLSVTNHFWVTVTLTSDLVFKNYCVQSISPILFDVGIPNLGWWFRAYHFESFWPWHWLLASFLVFSCYITAIFPQMCLILDQFLWGHSSHVCDISCFQTIRECIKQFGSRSGPTFFQAWSGSKLFAKVISRWQKSRRQRVKYRTTSWYYFLAKTLA